MIEMDEIINYTAFAAGRKEIFGNERKTPYLVDPKDVKPGADPIDRWIAALSVKYKETGSNAIKELLLKFENFKPVDMAGFKELNKIMLEIPAFAAH